MPCKHRRDFFLKVKAFFAGRGAEMQREIDFWSGTENVGIGQTSYGMFGERNFRGKRRVSRWIRE